MHDERYARKLFLMTGEEDLAGALFCGAFSKGNAATIITYQSRARF